MNVYYTCEPKRIKDDQVISAYEDDPEQRPQFWGVYRYFKQISNDPRKIQWIGDFSTKQQNKIAKIILRTEGFNGCEWVADFKTKQIAELAAYMLNLDAYSFDDPEEKS